MMLSTSAFATAALIAAIADRLVLQRHKLEMIGIGVAEQKKGVLRIPLQYINRAKRLKGARVEFWLRDSDHPTTIIPGEHRTLDLAVHGLNNEFLTFKPGEVRPGRWQLHVRVTHGDCRWNPLYRLFPLQTILRESVFIGGND